MKLRNHTKILKIPYVYKTLKFLILLIQAKVSEIWTNFYSHTKTETRIVSTPFYKLSIKIAQA